MDKKHYRPIPRNKKERIGEPTGLLDCERHEILTGDFVAIAGTDYSGPVMWNRKQSCYGVFMGLWYRDRNPYNPDCYGKFICVPRDNGMRMQLKRIERIFTVEDGE